MRSIRSSMMVYLFVLLFITLAVVGVVIDQVTKDALEAREKAGETLIQRQYEERCDAEVHRTYETLLNHAKTMYGLMTELSRHRVPVEFVNYQALVSSAQFMFSLDPLAQVSWVAMVPPFTVSNQPPGPPLAETERLFFRMYFANLSIPDEYKQRISDTTIGSDYQQINAGGGQEWHSIDDRKLKFDQKEIDAKFTEHGKMPDPAALFDILYDTALPVSGHEKVYRVILKVPHLGFRGRGPAPIGGLGPGLNPAILRAQTFSVSTAVWMLSGCIGPPPSPVTPSRVPGTPIDNTNLPKLYIQCARPVSAIEPTLTEFANQRDNELATLSQDIRDIQSSMRIKLLIIGLLAFLAVTIGGPVIISAGLRPVGKLSEAVSRVSEKDFKLSHDGKHLVQELVPIHSRLTQTLDLLQRAFSREKQAVADISHELRTPIAALMATIDVALRKPRTPEEYRNRLEECRLISKQLGQLVERIMTLASLDAGNDRTVVSRTDAVELATGCAAMIRPLATNNGISVHVHPPEDLIELDTDSGKLREVLMNLLHNAVEYNRPDGSIDLSLRREKSNAIFEVRDTGIGIAPDIKDKIFERFFRADPSRQATGVHAGLGLAIVKEYVTRLNGEIIVESEQGVGTTFRVVLPAVPTIEQATSA